MKLKLYYLTGLAALALAGFAAYFSIFGLVALLGKSVLGLGIAIEFAKIVSVTYMYGWRGHTPRTVRWYFWVGIAFAMILTSVGIYGFLTNSFQKQGKIFDINEIKTQHNITNAELVKSEIAMLQEQVDIAKNRLKILNDSRSSQEQRLNESMSTLNYRFIDKMRADIDKSDSDIAKTNQEISNLIEKIQNRNTQLGKIQQENFEIENSNTNIDVGPLRFLATVFGKDMKYIVNILIILLMFIFDPMAIMLLIATNIQIAKLSGKTKNVVSEVKTKRKYTKRVKAPLEEIFFKEKK